MELHERIHELSLVRSFFFPSHEAYGQTAGFYDYGPTGALIKKKIEGLWRSFFLKTEGYHEIESSVITPEDVLVASGHVKSFGDPVVDCLGCNSKVRADVLYENKSGEKWDGKIETLRTYFDENTIVCPSCGGNFSEPYMFNLMFKTGMGGDLAPAYCRPETAQGIFVAFPRIYRNHGTALPMGVGQVGRSFRNEISPRKGLVRMREFTQLELEYFFDPAHRTFPKFGEVKERKLRILPPDKEKPVEASLGEIVEKGWATDEVMAHFLLKQWDFYRMLNIPEEKMWFRVLRDAEVPHYSKGNVDMEVQTSYGVIETTGNAYRTDFDLSSHAKISGKDFSVFIEERKESIVPHVFELSMGVDRLFFVLLESCYRPKTEEKEWEWFDFPPAIAPYDLCVFPLMKKDGLKEKAQEIASMLRGAGLDVLFQVSGSIGKRYARADEIGVPYAVTLDYQTLEDDTVTVRFRNDGKQERVPIGELESRIRKYKKEGKVAL